MKEGIYFREVLGSHNESFLKIFQEIWNIHVQSFPKKYRDSRQLLIGARFRPVLVCWGYVLTSNVLDQSKKKELANLALYIELLHKATLLIDDLIDNDSTRHGELSFHSQYSDHEAILFAIYLLGDSLEQLTLSLKNKTRTSEDYFQIAQLLGTTIKEMTVGALKEINLEGEQITSISKIKRIIELQTVSLIKNGLLVGFKYGNGKKDLNKYVDSIGYDCGYIFQLLNDLEPFGSISLNSQHKGGSGNVDILRSRKNIVVAFTFNQMNAKDKKEFHRLILKNGLDSSSKLEAIQNFYFKYNTIKEIENNLHSVVKNIREKISLFRDKSEDDYLIRDFKKFLNFLFNEAINRLGVNNNQNKLSEILRI